MPVFAVTYEYTDDAAGRDEHRPEHVAFLSGQHEAGRLVVSGPTSNGAGALLVFAGESADDVAALLDADPFRREGLIARRTITPWKPFFGAERLTVQSEPKPAGAAR
ncbi:YciI family protein [Sinomonas sp. ASV486]|uniref:YciI family protein n=1 Tax=Sinomonas puerhi TaxID=3238584 RepID=A0AB39L2W0_9MICC|nr:YciI family protein [Sinomonas sp. ASV486]MDQ4489438.1 YciI family protein [Sinomonas sp. ASV486]